MKTLEEVLETITYESSETCPCSGIFAALVQEQMPDYDIEVFDMDEDDYTSPGDTIAATVKGETVEDIQTQDWNTECGDTCYYIVAIKLK